MLRGCPEKSVTKYQTDAAQHPTSSKTSFAPRRNPETMKQNNCFLNYAENYYQFEIHLL